MNKEWYTLIPPSIFTMKNFGLTITTKTHGTTVASNDLKVCDIELSLSNINKNEAFIWFKTKLCVEDIHGYNYLLKFNSMGMNRDKFCSLIKKIQTIV